jgi:hypothetical protein
MSSTPPRTWRSDAASAAIGRRRELVDDQSAWSMPDTPFAVARWVRAHPARSHAHRVEDFLDVLRLTVALEREIAELQSWALEAAAAHGTPWRDVAEVFGLASRQSVESLRKRRLAVVNGLPSSEKAWRRHRRAIEEEAAAGPGADRRAAWLRQVASEFDTLRTVLLAHRPPEAPLADDDEGWMDELERDQREHNHQASALAVLEGAAGEVEPVPELEPALARIRGLAREWYRLSQG